MTIASSSTLSPEETLDCDVVIVGSGAAGSVVAAELAASGVRVIVLEEGPYVPQEEYKNFRPSQSLRKLWRNAAMTIAIGLGNSPTINVTMGRCIGGSSVLTGGVCFRTPEEILDHWSSKLGLTDLTPDRLTPFFDEVESTIRVNTVPENMRSEGIKLFAKGAAQSNFSLSPLRRNTHQCKGCGRCNFGCPKGAKLSVDVTYLPRALKDGAQVISDARVHRILHRGKQVYGVSVHKLDPSKRITGSFNVRAERVLLAAGAMHTPLLIQKSLGKKLRHVGRNLTFHPSFRMIARFDKEVHGWKGALQSAYSKDFEKDRFTMVGLFVPPGVLAATMPGFGPAHTDRAKQIPNMAMFGGLIHDTGGGILRGGLGSEPIVTYRMSPEDRIAVPLLLRRMAETFIAAGAQEVFIPVLGHDPIAASSFNTVDFDRIPLKRLECASQHPLGSCRMGTQDKSSAVNENGQVWGVNGLYVADGSVIPTSLGVNPQVTVMTMALRIGRRLAETIQPRAWV
jgi:choline dehydrogenase-like flavoprotein